MYISSVEFTDFSPFAPGSRMEFAPVPDRPDDLAEVHLITGENGTGKSRLLCLLAAALGDARALQARCRKEDTAEFAVGWRQEGVADEPEPVMTLRLGKEGVSATGTRSETIYAEARHTAAFARAGVSFVSDTDFSKAITENAWSEGRLNFRPSGAYTESLLRKLHKIVVAARLGENERMQAFTEKLEKTLGEVLGTPFAFFPRSHPEEIMCLKINGAAPLSMNQCPDGLRSLIGWLVDAALVMDTLGEAHPERMARRPVDAEEMAGHFRRLKESLTLQSAISDAESRVKMIREVKKDEQLKRRDIQHWEEQLATMRSRLESIPAVISAPEGPAREMAFNETPCVILLDEIETHLHPGWQRQVLPAFQRMFPKAQIFVATHSPFVAASLNYGQVHILRRGESGSVQVETRMAEKGDSYMTAVQEVLGMKHWFDPETERELEEFELLLDKAYTSNGSSEEAMRLRAADFFEEKNRYSAEVKNMVGNLVAQYDRNRAAMKKSP